MTIPATYEAARLALFGDEVFPEEIDGSNRSVSAPPDEKDFDEDDFNDEEPAHGRAGPTFVARLGDYDCVHSFVAECLGESLASIPALRGFSESTLTGSLEQRGERYVFWGQLMAQDEDEGTPLSLVFFDSPDGVIVVGVGERLHYEGDDVFEEVAQVSASVFYMAEATGPAVGGEWFLG